MGADLGQGVVCGAGLAWHSAQLQDVAAVRGGAGAGGVSLGTIATSCAAGSRVGDHAEVGGLQGRRAAAGRTSRGLVLPVITPLLGGRGAAASADAVRQQAAVGRLDWPHLKASSTSQAHSDPSSDPSYIHTGEVIDTNHRHPHEHSIGLRVLALAQQPWRSLTRTRPPVSSKA